MSQASIPQTIMMRLDIPVPKPLRHRPQFNRKHYHRNRISLQSAMSKLIRRVLFLIAFFFVADIKNVLAETNASAVSGEKSLQVLFIGNSYTFFNDLPVMLSEMSNALNSAHGIQAKMVAVPAATLQQLWDIGDAAKA